MHEVKLRTQVRYEEDDSEDAPLLRDGGRSRYPQRVWDDIEAALAEEGPGTPHEVVMKEMKEWLIALRASRSTGRM